MEDIKIYNLRIVPPEPLFEEVTHFKAQFIDQFGKQPYSKSKPHITLAHFNMPVKYEDELLQALSGLSSIKQFIVKLQGFDVFNKTNVLLLKVEESEAISTIHEQIKELWPKSVLEKQGLPSISSTPHMTISKTKTISMLNDSFSLFKEIEYQKTFEVTHLTLVSRYNYKTWDWKYNIELSQ